MTTGTITPPDADADAELLTPVERLLRIAMTLAPGQQATIENVSWEDYEGLMAAREAAGRYFRLTYDRGSLEIKPTSLAHELFKKILALLIEAWLSETGGSYLPGGNVTVQLRLKKRGFEPDECYYVQNRARMAGRRQLDPATDPPPDLVIEAEVSRAVTARRLAVFAGLGVPEVWRYDGTRVTVLLLTAAGEYEESVTSRAVPTFPFPEVPRYVALAESSDDYAVVDRAFRAWVRSRSSGSG